MKNLFYKLILIFVVSGCANHSQIYIPDVTVVDIPTLNKKTTVEIGDSLVEKSKLYTYEGLELRSTLTDSGFSREYIMTPHNLRLVKKDKKGNKFYLAKSTNYYVNDKMFGNKVPLENQHLIVKTDDSLEFSGYFDLTTAGTITTVNPNFRIGKVVDENQTNFKQELIHNGKSNNTIKFSYREFTDKMARPSYTQEVQYDLTESNTIGFKGVRIEIIKATNISLTYKVLKSFPYITH